MASPGELVRTMAEALGLPEPTITVHDRNLVTAGLRSKSGRGWGAAKVTARDAAHLLTAVLASDQVKDSVRSVQRYSETQPDLSFSSEILFAMIGIAELENLPNVHSFIDALETLIASAASGTLFRAMQDNSAPSTIARRTAPLLEVAALTPGTIGDIRVAGTKGGRTANVRYVLPGPWPERTTAQAANDEIEAWEAKIAQHGIDTDLEQYRRISARTIVRIGDLLSGEGR